MSNAPAYLRMPAIAEVVADAIGQGTAGDYLLHAWVVMPNHVHLLITPHVEVPALLRRLKGTSAREATNCWGKRVGRSGRTRAMIVSCGMPTNSNESRAISSKTRCEPGSLDRQKNTPGRVSRGRAG